MGHVVGLLLAAGFGRRYGAQKLLEPMPSGDCVARMACRNLQAGTDRVVAIVRPNDPDLTAVLAKEGAEVIHFENAHLGMGATLAFGVTSSATSLGWLVALGDMPSIKVATIQALAETLRAGKSMVIPIHQGQRGHPVGFGSIHYERLRALKGDQGARSIVARYAADGVEIPFDDAGILLDIDTPQDLVCCLHPMPR